MAIYGPEPDTFEGPYAPEFYRAAEVLGDDPAAMEMLRSGYRPPVQYDAPEPESQGRFGDAFDSVVRSLAGQSLRSQFGKPRRGLESFGVGLAQGILDGRMLDMQRREKEAEAGEKRIADVNKNAAARTLSAREAAQRLAAARGEKRAAAEAAKVTLPDEYAAVVGLPPGSRVSPDEYTRARQRWLDAKRGEPKPKEPKDEGGPRVTRARFLSLQGKKATLMRRIAQMEAKLGGMAYQDEKAERLRGDLDGVRAELEGVDYELSTAPEEWMRAAGGGPAIVPREKPGGIAAGGDLDTSRARGGNPFRGQPAAKPQATPKLDAATDKIMQAMRASGLTDPDSARAYIERNADVLRKKGANLDALRGAF